MSPRRIAAMFVGAAVAALAPASALALEAPATEAPTAVTATEATLHGQLNPNAPATAGGHFTWAQGASCEGNETEAQAEQTGEKLALQATLSGLVPASEYSYCAVATHQEGETFESLPGPAVTFTTTTLAPSVASQSAPFVAPFEAVLEGQVNPQNEPTTSCSIEWGRSLVSEHNAECQPETLEGFGDQSVSRRIGGLEPATTYKFRIVVANATGTTDGAEAQFTTSATEPPLINGESFSGVSAEGVTLAAQVNPNYQETRYAFEYATDEAMTAPTTVEPPEGTEPFPGVFEDREATVQLPSGLSPATTYYYRVAATNATGTTKGVVQSFTTEGPPAISGATAASHLTRTGVQLAGASIDPFGLQTTYAIRYETQAAYEQALVREPSHPYATAGTALPTRTITPTGSPADFEPQPAAIVQITELQPGTTYHYALEAHNSQGAVTGPDGTFTTLPATPPSVSTGAAQGISPFASTLTGSFEGKELPTVASFEFGTTPALGSTVPAAVQHGTPEQASAAFTGTLAPATTYYYRLTATNADGTAYGATLSFTTPSLPGAGAEAHTLGPLIPYMTIAALEAKEPREATGTGPVHHGNAKKLKAALKKCRKKHGKPRKHCERKARKRYG